MNLCSFLHRRHFFGASLSLQPDHRSFGLGLTLLWVGLTLLGIYAVTVAAAAYPLQLLQPAWIDRVAGSLQISAGPSRACQGLPLICAPPSPNHWRRCGSVFWMH